MERLTERNNCTMHENGVCCTHFLSPECHEVSGNCSAGCKWEEVAWSALASYEDSGFTPAEIKSLYAEWDVMMSVLNSIGGGYTHLRELAEADRDGRLMVLPCRVGDTVYRLQYVEQTPGRFVVGVVEIEFALIWLDEFGKTVFLTREEAEKALETMMDE